MATQTSSMASAGTRRTACPGCGGRLAPFVELLDVPTNSCILLETKEAALRYPRGDVVLGFCDGCGFICNLAFDPQLTEYSSRYEETQGFSPTFQRFHRALALDLIERYRIRGKDVLEIGCGKGEFLALLCELGANRGIGFDPSYDEERDVLAGVPAARVICDFYSPAHGDMQADLVCCKMTLEHIVETGEFVRLARRAMRPGSDSLMYFLLPNAMRIVRDCAFEDIYYEHCSYFTAGSLSRLFRACGFEIRRLATEYSGQYLAIEACLAEAPTQSRLAGEDDLDAVCELVASFPQRLAEKMDAWRERLASAQSRGSVVVWGSGSKALAFLSAIDRDRVIRRVIDINPYRHGHFVPGSAQPIVSPSSLQDDPPATVIVMNAVYRDEIAADLARMNLHPDILAL